MNKRTFPGKLVVLEGIDGSGKSSLATRITRLLQEDSCSVVVTREPGGTPGGIAIRNLISQGNVAGVPLAECLLFAADRALHVAEVVIPALERGDIVICDRMSDSTIAYQGAGRGVSRDIIQSLNAWTLQGVQADLTVYVEIEYSTAQQRIHTTSRNQEIVAYDQEHAAFFKRVIHAYEELYANRTDVMRIDGTLSIETNAQHVYHAVCTLVGGSEEIRH
jgi:dTMP kinase